MSRGKTIIDEVGNQTMNGLVRISMCVMEGRSSVSHRVSRSIFMCPLFGPITLVIYVHRPYSLPASYAPSAS